MANAKHTERRLARLQSKYAKAGGSPRKLRRLAEVKAKRAQKETETLIPASLTPLVENVLTGEIINS